MEELFAPREYINVTFGRASVFKSALPALALLAEKANLTLSSKDGLILRTMNDQVTGDVDAFLFVPSSVMLDFSCKGGSYTFGVNLMMLVRALEDASFDHLVNLFVTPKTRILTVELENLSTGKCDLKSYDLEKAIKPPVDGVDPSKYEYNVLVGIPSDEFIRIFSQLEFGTPEVRIEISKNMLTFYIHKPIILRQELASCVIVGHLKEGPDVELKFPTCSVSSYMIAAKLTKMVWLCYSEKVPILLVIPMGALGTIHFYSRAVPDNSGPMSDWPGTPPVKRRLGNGLLNSSA
ncbi:hypothetical protein MLD38_036408 [Melastoma candidum]|uniref:Uncharacterized protein n=1 Tax=Melastoma candidum TaxID=119954 RepID=A0ACB9LIZ2_9MYRT|nr:hypothetical protein MLD38_036408 [Melastoma candidum]